MLAAGSLTAAGATPNARPGFLDLQVSPDGSHLAALVEQRERRHLVVVSRSDGTQLRVTESFAGRVETFFWANRDRLVFTSADDTGLYGIARDGTGLTTLIEPGAGPAAPRLVDPIASDAEHILVALPLTSTQHTVYRLHVETGERERLSLPMRDARDWHADRTGALRAVVVGNAPTGRVFYRADAGAAWYELGPASLAPPNFTLLGLTDDDRLVLAGPTGTGAYTLRVFDPANGQWQTLTDELPAHALPILRHAPLQRTLVALEYSDAMPRQLPGAPFWGALRATVDHALPGSSNLLYQMSDDELVLLVLACTDPAECMFYLLDRRADRLEFLGHRTEPAPVLPAHAPSQVRASRAASPAGD